MKSIFKNILCIIFLSSTLPVMAGSSIDEPGQSNISTLESSEAVTIGACSGLTGSMVGGISVCGLVGKSWGMSTGLSLGLPLGSASVGFAVVGSIIASLLSYVEKEKLTWEYIKQRQVPEIALGGCIGIFAGVTTLTGYAIGAPTIAAITASTVLAQTLSYVYDDIGAYKKPDKLPSTPQKKSD